MVDGAKKQLNEKSAKAATKQNTSLNKSKNNDVEDMTTNEKLDHESITPLVSILNSSNQSGFDNEFLIRRKKTVEQILSNQGIRSGEIQLHNEWFENVYDSAKGDFSSVPWASLQPKPELMTWLKENAGEGRTAVEIGCGLGDNAEALSYFGWQVTAFDISKSAIDWSKKRFPNTKVQFHCNDLMNLPTEWSHSFELVFECFNLQAFLPGKLRSQAIAATASLVQENGELLLISLLRKTIDIATGPPWPLTPENIFEFKTHGLTMTSVCTELENHDGFIVPQITTAFKRIKVV